MNLVFCGTPEFAVPALKALLGGGHDIRLVVSQPDRPRGRGLELGSSPVKRAAVERGLTVIQPDKIRSNAEFRAQLEALRPDAIVVVGYGHIIPQWMIELPRHGNINLHASLLPKYRGAAPIQWAVTRGEAVTGVTTMRIDSGLDTGDVLLQEEVPIAPSDTAATLAPRLAEIGARLMVETLRQLASGTLQPRPQDHSRASLAPRLTKEDGRIDFSLPARDICNRVRGFQPWPGTFTTFRGKNLHITATQPGLATIALRPGELQVAGDKLEVGCGEASALQLLELQPEGKKRMSDREFILGYKPRPGEMLGE